MRHASESRHAAVRHFLGDVCNDVAIMIVPTSFVTLEEGVSPNLGVFLIFAF